MPVPLMRVSRFHLKSKRGISVPLSCDELFRKRGLTDDGEELFADIDPDGYKVGRFPIRVKCFKNDGMPKIYQFVNQHNLHVVCFRESHH